MTNIDFHNVLGLINNARLGLELFLEENPTLDETQKEKIKNVSNNIKEAINCLGNILKEGGQNN